jgi:hypothetical protein
MFSLNSFIYFFLRGIATAGVTTSESQDDADSLADDASTAGSLAPGIPLALLLYHTFSAVKYGCLEGESGDAHSHEALPDLDVLDQQIARRVSEIEARDRAEQGSNLPERLKTLKQNVTLVILDFVRTGLFEKDKLTVVTLVTLNIMCDEGLLQREYVDIITRGRVAEEVAPRGQELSVWVYCRR